MSGRKVCVNEHKAIILFAVVEISGEACKAVMVWKRMQYPSGHKS